MKIWLVAVAFLIGEGEGHHYQQQCQDPKAWPQFFDGLYCLLGSYRFQKAHSNFNVRNLNDWGKGGQQGIYITEENYETFLEILRSNYNLCLHEREKLYVSRIEDLNNLLEISLRNATKIECLDGTLRISGTFVRFSEVASTTKCGGREIERLEVFSTDKLYMDDYGGYTNSKTDFHLNLISSQLVYIKSNYASTRNYELANGNYLEIHERQFISKGASRAVIASRRYGSFYRFDQGNMTFIEMSAAPLAVVENSADNFAKAITNFKSFLREKLSNRILRNRILPFLTKITTHQRAKSYIDIHNAPTLNLNAGYYPYKSVILLSAELQLPLEDVRVLSDAKMIKSFDLVNFARNSTFEERQHRGFVSDLSLFLDSIINQLQGIEKAYSVPILKRIADGNWDGKVRGEDLSVVRQLIEEYEEYLPGIAELSLQYVAAANLEAQNLMNTLEQSNSPNNSYFFNKRRVARVVQFIGEYLSSIPLAVKLSKTESSVNNLEILLKDTEKRCNKRTGQVDDSNFCYIILPLLTTVNELFANPVKNYKELQSVFDKSNVGGFLDRVEKFIGENYEQFEEADQAIARLKLAVEKVLEIVDVVRKHDRLSQFESYISEVATLKFGKAIVEDVANLVEDNADNFEIFQYKKVKPADKDRALKLLKTITAIDDFIKSQTILLIYNNLINGIKQNSFPLSRIYLQHYNLKGKIDASTTSVNGIIDRINHLKKDWQSGRISKYDELKRSSVEFTNRNPFYIWHSSNEGTMHDLLRGQEVLLIPDVEASDRSLTAIKFNKIDLKFTIYNSSYNIFEEEAQKWTFALTHLGDSKFNCDGKIYSVPTLSQRFVFTAAVKPGTSEPRFSNSLYEKIEGGDFVLSPFATWKIQIVKGAVESEDAKSMLESISNVELSLMGKGQYYEGNSKLCSEDLDEYYNRVAANDVFLASIKKIADIEDYSSNSQCPDPKPEDL